MRMQMRRIVRIKVTIRPGIRVGIKMKEEKNLRRKQYSPLDTK